jgi:hypothetical protein
MRIFQTRETKDGSAENKIQEFIEPDRWKEEQSGCA